MHYFSFNFSFTIQNGVTRNAVLLINAKAERVGRVNYRAVTWYDNFGLWYANKYVYTSVFE